MIPHDPFEQNRIAYNEIAWKFLRDMEPIGGALEQAARNMAVAAEDATRSNAYHPVGRVLDSSLAIPARGLEAHQSRHKARMNTRR